MDTRCASAVIVEPNSVLAGVLHDTVASWGMTVASFSTHAGAMKYAETCDRTDFLAACVPVSDDDRADAYLFVVRDRQSGNLPTVLMLSDPLANRYDAPDDCIVLLKPFSSTAFRDAAIESGLVLAEKQ